MRIPYEIATRFSHAAMDTRYSKLSSCIFSALREIFFGANFLSVLVQMLCTYSENERLRSLNPLYIEAVLRHVCSRTWYFSKLLEFIRVKDVIGGKLRLGIAETQMTDRYIKSILKAMTESGVLIKLRLQSTKIVTSMYGFNIFHILPFLLVALEYELMNSDDGDNVEVPRCQVALKAHKQLVILTRFIPYFDTVFDTILNQQAPIEDVDKFIKRIKNALAERESFGEPFDLAQELKKVKVKKSELAPGKWRRESDVEYPLPGIQFLLASHFEYYLDQISDNGIRRVLDHANYLKFESEPQNAADAMPDEATIIN